MRSRPKFRRVRDGEPAVTQPDLRRIDGSSLLQTASTLNLRITDRFPSRGLATVASDTEALVAQTVKTIAGLTNPRWAIRVLVAFLGRRSYCQRSGVGP
jgi:hypothetical protein